MRKGFTLLELIFVIVIFGIMSKYGADILYKIYENYIYSNTFNRLQNQSEAAVKQIANRLQYRIKDSTISRGTLGGSIEPIGSNAGNETVLEWIGTDIDGWRGTTTPEWSGFIDLSASSVGTLNSPGTTVGTGIIPGTDLGLFFIGSNVDLNNSAFGWDGTNIKTSTTLTHADIAIHPVTFNGSAITSAMTTATDFTGSDVYEYYQLSRSAYAVGLVGTDLNFYYGYQPWLGQTASTNATSQLIMENVSSFKFTSMGDIMIIQVCVSDGNITGVGDYSVCKEKVVF